MTYCVLGIVNVLINKSTQSVNVVFSCLQMGTEFMFRCWVMTDETLTLLTAVCNTSRNTFRRSLKLAN